MMILALFALCCLILMALICTLNVLTFPRLTPSKSDIQPRVSVLIPARDEEDVIAQTVSCLLAQHYPDFEVLVAHYQPWL